MSLETEKRGHELQELVVQNQGAHFAAAFPFCWEIKDLLDQLLHQQQAKVAITPSAIIDEGKIQLY